MKCFLPFCETCDEVCVLVVVFSYCRFQKSLYVYIPLLYVTLMRSSQKETYIHLPPYILSWGITTTSMKFLNFANHLLLTLCIFGNTG